MESKVELKFNIDLESQKDATYESLRDLINTHTNEMNDKKTYVFVPSENLSKK